VYEVLLFILDKYWSLFSCSSSNEQVTLRTAVSSMKDDRRTVLSFHVWCHLAHRRKNNAHAECCRWRWLGCAPTVRSEGCIECRCDVCGLIIRQGWRSAENCPSRSFLPVTGKCWKINDHCRSILFKLCVVYASCALISQVGRVYFNLLRCSLIT
jgi:hypothetical protein